MHIRMLHIGFWIRVLDTRKLDAAAKISEECSAELFDIKGTLFQFNAKPPRVY